MKLHTASGVFENIAKAEDAKEYLLAQELEFTDGDIIITTLTPGEENVLLKAHADSPREMQEAVDVIRNYGGVDINMTA
ncbi:hypothetical protein [Mucilaginibacter antarcticus]|uniref:Uncharacterized protein n=1 Tax=Mucilaginibacter antarcticus TaxID=1855725 RepID=A0ABW5XP03_9SPHI